MARARPRRLRAATHRRIRNTSGADATYVIVGAKDGYVGRDGQGPPDEPRLGPVA